VSLLREFSWGDADYIEFCRLRQDWLRTPLGLNLSDDDLDAEKAQRLFGIYEKNSLVGGAAILVHADGDAQLRQMIISPSFQRRGYGRMLVKHIEASMRKASIHRIFLLARLEAKVFYTRCGYARIGDEFMHVTIPHIRMEKAL